MRPRARLAAMLALAVLGAACGADEPGSAADPPASEAGSGQAAGGDHTDASASFTVMAYQGEEVLGGSEIEFSALLGQGTPVILNFWAAACPPCRLEMPWFEATYREYEGRVLLVGVDVGPFTGLGSNEAGAQLLDELEITYPAGYAVDDTPVREFSVTNMPFTVFFDADGEIVASHGGILTEQQIQEFFEVLAGGAE